MSTAPHPVTHEEIMALLDGELSSERAQAVSVHTESCSSCQQVFGSLLHTAHALTSWTVGPTPSQLSSGVLLAGFRNPSNVGSLRGSPAKPRMRAFAWAAGLGACLLLFLAIAIPNLLRSRTAANEASSVGSLRAINAAAETYNQRYGRYPQSLQELGPPSNGQVSENGANLIDGVLAKGQKSGYRYSYQAKPGFGYSAASEPLHSGDTGVRHFSTDQTGIISADNVPLDGQLNPPGSPVHVDKYIPSEGKLGQLVESANAELAVQNQLSMASPMIARTVSLAFLVKDFDSSRKSLDSILIRYNGYSANLTVTTPEGSARSLQASLRIPAAHLAAATTELKSLGKVENENQTGEEVTQQHADLLARLKNSRETEQRLQAILTQRTGKISDVLEVEQEIARVRGEIEQMEAEQKNLEHRVDFATIDLKLAEEYKAKLDSAVPSFSTQLHNSLVNGYRNVSDTAVALILFFAEYGPILLFWAFLLLTPAFLVWRRWRHVAFAA